MRVLYGSNKGVIRRGDEMFGQFNLGSHPNDYTYSSDAIEGEALGSDGTATAFTLSWTPVQPGTVAFEAADGTVAYRDDSTGKIVTAAGVAAGTIDYATGAITFTSAPAADVSVNYVYDNISANNYLIA